MIYLTVTVTMFYIFVVYFITAMLQIDSDTKPCPVFGVSSERM